MFAACEEAVAVTESKLHAQCKLGSLRKFADALDPRAAPGTGRGHEPKGFVAKGRENIGLNKDSKTQ